MTDKLNMDALNSLQQPILAWFIGDADPWPVHDFEVACGIMRIDVCGLLQVKDFCDLKRLQDADGVDYDPEIFWSDYASGDA
jgi:hypothetical protein